MSRVQRARGSVTSCARRVRRSGARYRPRYRELHVGAAPPGAARAPASLESIRCSFCGKRGTEVDKIIAGPTPAVAICNGVRRAVLRDHRRGRQAARSRRPIRPRSGAAGVAGSATRPAGEASGPRAECVPADDRPRYRSRHRQHRLRRRAERGLAAARAGRRRDPDPSRASRSSAGWPRSTAHVGESAGPLRARRDGHRGALLRRQRPDRVRRRPGSRSRAARRRRARRRRRRSYTPQQVKAAVCGHGRADKEQVARMVARLLGLSAPPSPDHAADALAVAICDLNRAPLAHAVGRGAAA